VQEWHRGVAEGRRWFGSGERSTSDILVAASIEECARVTAAALKAAGTWPNTSTADSLHTSGATEPDVARTLLATIRDLSTLAVPAPQQFQLAAVSALVEAFMALRRATGAAVHMDPVDTFLAAHGAAIQSALAAALQQFGVGPACELPFSGVNSTHAVGEGADAALAGVGDISMLRCDSFDGAVLVRSQQQRSPRTAAGGTGDVAGSRPLGESSGWGKWDEPDAAGGSRAQRDRVRAAGARSGAVAWGHSGGAEGRWDDDDGWDMPSPPITTRAPKTAAQSGQVPSATPAPTAAAAEAWGDDDDWEDAPAPVVAPTPVSSAPVVAPTPVSSEPSSQTPSATPGVAVAESVPLLAPDSQGIVAGVDCQSDAAPADDAPKKMMRKKVVKKVVRKVIKKVAKQSTGGDAPSGTPPPAKVAEGATLAHGAGMVIVAEGTSFAAKPAAAQLKAACTPPGGTGCTLNESAAVTVAHAPLCMPTGMPHESMLGVSTGGAVDDSEQSAALMQMPTAAAASEGRHADMHGAQAPEARECPEPSADAGAHRDGEGGLAVEQCSDESVGKVTSRAEVVDALAHGWGWGDEGAWGDAGGASTDGAQLIADDKQGAGHGAEEACGRSVQLLSELAEEGAVEQCTGQAASASDRAHLEAGPGGHVVAEGTCAAGRTRMASQAHVGLQRFESWSAEGLPARSVAGGAGAGCQELGVPDSAAKEGAGRCREEACEPAQCRATAGSASAEEWRPPVATAVLSAVQDADSGATGADRVTATMGDVAVADVGVGRSMTEAGEWDAKWDNGSDDWDAVAPVATLPAAEEASGTPRPSSALGACPPSEPVTVGAPIVTENASGWANDWSELGCNDWDAHAPVATSPPTQLTAHCAADAQPMLAELLAAQLLRVAKQASVGTGALRAGGLSPAAAVATSALERVEPPLALQQVGGAMQSILAHGLGALGLRAATQAKLADYSTVVILVVGGVTVAEVAEVALACHAVSAARALGADVPTILVGGTSLVTAANVLNELLPAC
jgi:hypothetical protein